MTLDLQQRPAQYGYRWDYTRCETENNRVILQADPIKNGRNTHYRFGQPLKQNES
jgi:hypothetical protein